MHEYSIVSALFARIEAEARARGSSHVCRVKVRIGELAGVEPTLLATAFETFRQGTICSDAELEIDRVPARWTCPACGGAVPTGGLLRCAACGAPARLSAGDEILLERLEMEVA